MISVVILSFFIAPPVTEAEPTTYYHHPYWERHCEGVAERGVDVADAGARLDSRDEDDRVAAVLDMACFGENARPWIPKMIRVFASRHGENQSIAKDAVVHLEEIAVPFLIKALDDPDPRIRENSCQALVGIGPKAKAALGPLKARLGKKGYDPATLKWAIRTIEAKDVHTFYYPR